MTIGAVVVLVLSYGTLCSSQFVQPRKFLEKILDMHEKSRNVLSGGDTMKLNVDLSSAKDFPARDDLYLRVFNKNNNVTLCETRLFDHVANGFFPCQFKEADAQLRTGANNFALEVYSNINWKVYNTQSVPDIHYFNTVAYEGHYEDFFHPDELVPYTKKIAVTSALAALLALLIGKGPVTMLDDLKYIAVDAIGGQIVSLTLFTGSLVKFAGISASNGVLGTLSFIGASLRFLYDIFSSGLASPFSMLLSGLGLLADLLKSGVFGTFSFVGASLQFLYDIFSSGLASPFSMLLSGLGFFANLLSSGTSSIFSGLYHGLWFLFDIFSAGLGSPFSMVLSALSFSANTVALGSKAALTGMQIAAVSSVSFIAGLGSNSFSLLGALLTAILTGSKSAALSSGSLLKTLFIGFINLPKFSFLVTVASLQFLFDIFYAGLGSPASMVASGVKGLATLLTYGVKSSISGVGAGGQFISTATGSLFTNIFSGLFKGSVLLSDGVNAVFHLIFYLSTGSAKNLQLLLFSTFKFLKNLPSTCVFSVLKSLKFLYDIFSSGLASPCGMLLSGCTSLSSVLTSGVSSTYKHSTSALVFAFQSIIKSFNNILSSCLFAIFGGFNLVGGGLKGISTGCYSLFSLLFSILKFFRSKFFSMIFKSVTSTTSGPPPSLSPPKSALKKWTKSGSAPSRKVHVFAQPIVTYEKAATPTLQERFSKRSGLASLGMFCALYLVAPGKMNIVPGFSEAIQQSDARIAVSASASASSRPSSGSSVISGGVLTTAQKTVITKTEALSHLINNFMANRKNPGEIPAGCPLRRAGFF